jgi:hypothetical protein
MPVSAVRRMVRCSCRARVANCAVASGIVTRVGRGDPPARRPPAQAAWREHARRGGCCSYCAFSSRDLGSAVCISCSSAKDAVGRIYAADPPVPPWLPGWSFRFCTSCPRRRHRRRRASPSPPRCSTEGLLSSRRALSGTWPAPSFARAVRGARDEELRRAARFAVGEVDTPTHHDLPQYLLRRSHQRVRGAWVEIQVRSQ